MIRRIKPSDYKTIYDINQVCHKPFEPNIDLLFKLQVHDTWVAVEDGNVVGFLIARVTERDEVNIYNVAVLAEHRGKGIATALVRECEKVYWNYPLIYLHVDVNNPAQKLYFDLGYRATSIKLNMYGDDRNGIHMQKVLGA